MKSTFLAVAIATTAIAGAPATSQTLVTNSTPAVGWHYGAGNDYTPANTLVLTANDGTQVYGRWHVPGDFAPASNANGVYSFALGTSSIAFDFGFTAPNAAAYATDLSTASFTLKDIGTGFSVGYPLALFAADANAYRGANSFQDSERATFGFLLGPDYDPNRNDTYQLTLAAGGNTINYFAQIGSGAAIASPTPEPATWGMMILGFGLAGLGLRRQVRRSEVKFDAKIKQIAAGAVA